MDNKNEKDKINEINKKIIREIKKENIIGVYGFTRQLIKIIDSSHSLPSIYYENCNLIFTYIYNIRQFFIKYQIKNKLNCKVYYNMLSPLENGLLFNIYFSFIIADIEIKDNENIVEEKMNNILSLIQKLDSPLMAFFANYFCFLDFNSHMFFLPIEIKINFYLQFIKLMNNEFISYYNIEPDYIKNDAKSVYEIILEILKSLGQIKELEIEQFKNKIIDSILDLISNEEIYNEIILNWIINELNEKYLFACLEKILNKICILTKNEENLGQKTLIIIERLLKYNKSQNNSLIFENFSHIIRPLIIIINNSIDFIKLELSDFLKKIEIVIIFVNEFIKNYNRIKRSKIIDLILNVIVIFLQNIKKKLNKDKKVINNNIEKVFKDEEDEEEEEEEEEENKKKEENTLSEKEMDDLEKSKINYENYIFKEKDLIIFESIFSIIIKSKLTIFELGNLPVILTYMDPYHNKKKSIELLNKIVNEENKIDTEKKTYFIKMIIKNILTSYIIHSKKIFIPNSVKDNIKKVINLINNPNPEIYFQLLLVFSDIYIGTLKENTEGTVSIFCESILYLSYKIFLNCKNEDNNNNISANEEKNLDFFFQRDSIKKNEESIISSNFDDSLFNDSEITEQTNENDEIEIQKISKEKGLEMINYILLFLKERIKQQFRFFPNEILPVLNKSIILFEQMKIYKDIFYNECIEYIQLYLKILWKEVQDSNNKIEGLSNIINTLTQTTILTKEHFLEIAESIITISQSLPKRADLIKIKLSIVDLYCNNCVNDKNKVKEIIKEAQKQAEFTIIRTEHIYLADIILVKMIELCKKSKDYIDIEESNRFIDSIEDLLMKISCECKETNNIKDYEKFEKISFTLKKNEKELFKLMKD